MNLFSTKYISVNNSEKLIIQYNIFVIIFDISSSLVLLSTKNLNADISNCIVITGTNKLTYVIIKSTIP